MRRKRESGFALLLVFAMAGCIAIMLYSQMPRVAFEAQRDKEALLQERGEQYVRGIQLFVARWTKYPQSIEELEQFGGKRYLRKRYKDPMTGKDEWRLIRIDAAGRLVDSKVQKTEEKKQQTTSTFITEAPAMTTVNAAQAAAANPGLRRRASDQMPGMEGAMQMNPQGGPSVLGQSANPQAATPILPNSPNNPNAQGVPVAFDPNVANNPGNTPELPGQPGQQPGEQPGQQPGQPVAANQIYPNGIPGSPGAAPGQVANDPAVTAAQAQMAALQAQLGRPVPGQQQPQQYLPGQPIPQGGQMPSWVPGQTGQPNVTPGAQVGYPVQPGYPAPTGYGQMPTQQMPGQYPIQQQQFPGQQQQQFPGQQQQQFPGQQQQFPGQQQQQYPIQQQQQFPGQQQQYPGQQQQQFPGQQQQFPGQQQQGLGGYPTSPATQMGRPGATPNAAAALIMGQLTQPRPMQNNVQGAPGLAVGGGIAGVASTLDSDSIKVFNERQKYNEWEFVYDMKNDKRLAQQTQGRQSGNQPGQPLGGSQPGMNSSMNPGMNQGMNPGMTNPGGFNQNPNQQQPGQSPFPGNSPRFPGPGTTQPGYPAPPGRR